MALYMCFGKPHIWNSGRVSMGTRRPLADKRENPLRDLSAIYRYTVYTYIQYCSKSFGDLLYSSKKEKFPFSPKMGGLKPVPSLELPDLQRCSPERYLDYTDPKARRVHFRKQLQEVLGALTVRLWACQLHPYMYCVSTSVLLLWAVFRRYWCYTILKTRAGVSSLENRRPDCCN